MGRKKKKAGGEGPPGAPDWVVTFTDLISLLVTFFVLLLTFSSMVSDNRMMVDSIMGGRGGIIKSQSDVLVDYSQGDLLAATDLLRGSRQAHSRPADKLLDSIEEMGQAKTDDQLELNFDAEPDGLVIEFGADEAFPAGSAEVSPSLRKSLGEIGRVLENYPNLIVVEGFTDGAFRPSGRYGNAATLGFARAENAAQILMSGSSISPAALQLASLGDGKPRGDNDTSAGRQANRRVQLRVVSLSKMRATHLEGLERKARGGH